MTTVDPRRERLYALLRKAVDHETAEALANELAVDVERLATKDDLAAHREDLRLMLDEFRRELRDETRQTLEEFRRQLRDETRQTLEEFRRQLREEFRRELQLTVEASEHRVTGSMRAEFVSQTRVFVFSTIGAVAAVGGALVAAVRL